MQILLNQDVKKLGYRGDIVNVKHGYFRNYLFPRRLAEVLTPSLEKVMEKRREKLLMKKQQLLDNAKDVLKKLKGLTVTIKRKVSGKGKLYGAIVEEDVIKAIEESKNIRLEKEFVKMEHIKGLGEFSVMVHLGEGLEEAVNVGVEAEK